MHKLLPGFAAKPRSTRSEMVIATGILVLGIMAAEVLDKAIDGIYVHVMQFAEHKDSVDCFLKNNSSALIGVCSRPLVRS